MHSKISAFFALGLAVAVAGAGRAVHAADAVAKIAIRTDSTIASARAMVNRLQPVGTFRHEDLLRLSAAGGMLMAEIMPAARRVGQHRFNIEGSSADWILTYNEGPAGRPPAELLVLHRYDFKQADAGGIWSTTLHIRSSMVSSVEARAVTGVDHGRISLTHLNGVVRLAVYDRKLAPGGLVNLQASTLHDLRAQGPRQFRQYVIPLLKSVCGRDPFMAAPADVYRTFDQIPADPQVIQQIRRVLPALDSPLPMEREEGSRQLLPLGGQGVLAALRMDRTPLSPEQSGRLDAFIARYEDRRFSTAQEARSDASFLIDCLEFDDPAVRTLAAGELARLLDQPIDLDPAAPADKRSKLADTLRETALKTRISAATRPATRPAAPRAHFNPQPAASE